jgi:hypothetical protein
MGEQRTALILLLIFCFAIVPISKIRTLKAQEPLNLTIKPDGSLEPNTDLLERNGNIYTFNGDIFGTIMVQKGGIQLTVQDITFRDRKQLIMLMKGAYIWLDLIGLVHHAKISW